jgi:hypothetical protein
VGTMALMGAGKGAPGAVAFLPSSVSGLKLWLEPDVQTYQDSGFATPATANNDPLGGWKDQSGTGNHLTNATSSKRLTYKTSIAGSFAGMLADGVDDNLFTTAASGITIAGTQFTLFVVIKTPASLSTQCFVNIGGSSGNGGSGKAFRISSGGKLEFLKANAASLGTSTTTLSTSTLYVVGFDYNSPSGTFYLNSGTDGTVSSAQTFSNPTTDCFVGSQDNAATTPFAGHVIEVVYYDNQISGTDITNVISYERARYGI